MKRKGSGRFAGVAALLALAGCQTGAQIEEVQSARLRAYEGRTIAAFSMESGLVPVSFYPVATGRVFVFEGPTVVTSYGGYSNATACRLLVETIDNGRGATADGWTITDSTRTGPCQLLPF